MTPPIARELEPPVSLLAAARVWAKIGLLGFGGPAGQIALMHKELVEERRWIDEARFLHALNYCMLLPGPEAQQLAIYIGWLMHRARGGIVAGTLFVLPGYVAILVLSICYARFQGSPLVASGLFGLKAAVLALVVEAVLRIGRRALTTRASFFVAVSAFVALFLFGVPFPALILAAGVFGVGVARLFPERALPASPAGRADARGTVLERLAASGALAHTAPSLRRAARVLGVCTALWAAPVALLGLLVGRDSVLVQEGLFFSKAAVVTFGGAYAVLAYIAQRAVESYGWLLPGEMLDGLGLAETTPGPLILVVQFVAFMGAYRHPGALSPLLAGVVGASLAVWVTFVPCFAWIFLGGPYIEALRGNRALHAALSSITAAVVGVIANLSIWFGLHVLFAQVSERHWGPIHWLAPRLSSLDLGAALLAVLAFAALTKRVLGVPLTLLASVVLGFLWQRYVR